MSFTAPHLDEDALACVLAFAGIRSLLSACLVSRSFYDLAVRPLYATVALDEVEQIASFHTTVTIHRPSHGNLVKSFSFSTIARCTPGEQLVDILERIPHVLRLAIRYLEQLRPLKSRVSRAVHLMQNLRHLEVGEIGRTTTDLLASIPPLRYFASSRTFFTTQTPCPVVSAFLFNSCETLQVLEIHFNFIERSFDDHPTIRFPRLRALRAPAERFHSLDNRFATAFPALETCYLPHCRLPSTLLPGNFKRLQKLTITLCDPGATDTLALRALHLVNSPWSQSAQHLLGQLRIFQHTRLAQLSLMSALDVNELIKMDLMRTCPQLLFLAVYISARDDNEGDFFIAVSQGRLSLPAGLRVLRVGLEAGLHRHADDCTPEQTLIWSRPLPALYPRVQFISIIADAFEHMWRVERFVDSSAYDIISASSDEFAEAIEGC